MKLIIQKAILNFRLDFKWIFSSPVSRAQRFSYLVKKYKCIIGNKRTIEFLGGTFSYDNRLMPALLPEYIFEIEDLSQHIDFNKICTVLDIGANTGQFGYVATRSYPHLNIYSFEPNSAIFPFLEKNSEPFKNWAVFNFGIGEKDEVLDFYYVEGKSSQGSLFSENAKLGLLSNQTTKTEVRIRRLGSDVREELKIPQAIDLVKIDVEGAEASVLASLKDVAWRFIYIELSESRGGGLSIKDALQILETTSNSIEVLFRSHPQGPSHTYQALFHNKG